MRCNFKQMTTEQAKTEFQKIFGAVTEYESGLGYSLNVKKCKAGIVVEKWYSPNYWKDVLEKKVLFSNGKIFENHK